MSNAAPLQLICPSCTAINRVPELRLKDTPVCGKCKLHLLSGKVISASDTNFNRYIQQSGLPVLVDFWAPWCGPCKSFAPVYSELAAEMSSRASFIKLDTEANQHTAAQFQIRSIPTLILFYQGREVTRISGALPKAQFTQWLALQLKSLRSN